jgi:hypothetical protein
MVPFAPRPPQGFALLLAALVLGILAMATLALAGARGSATERDAITRDALRQARDALLAYAADRAIDAQVGPGYLPCPDRDGDGWAEATCGSLSGDSGQAQRLGLLPWKTLALPPLRDADGELLRYAVSARHKGLLNCAASLGCIDMSPASALGTISVRDASGGWIHDGRIGDPAHAIAAGAAAVVIAAGLHGRLDAVPGIDDNTAFVDRTDMRAGNGDGFVAGPVASATGAPLADDRVIAIGYGDLMPRVMARVALEASHCLRLARDATGAWPAPEPACGDPTSIGRVPLAGLAGCNLASNTHAWWSTWSPYVLYVRPQACGVAGDCIHVLDADGALRSSGHQGALLVGVQHEACNSSRLACAGGWCNVRASEGLDVALAIP